MKSSLKVLVIAGGYTAAFLAASAAVAIRMAATGGPEAQAAGGMYAFGDSVVFVAVFGLLALLPTGAALVFLRPYRRFWVVLSRLCLAVAVTGLVAALLYAAGRHAPPSPLATLAGFSVLRILIAPLLALTFLVCALITPHRSPQATFLAATALEAALTGCVGAVWFFQVFLHR